jgi:hypothetical protein
LAFAAAAEDPDKAVLAVSAAMVLAVALALVALILSGAQNTRALPSFARQTGQQCVACHNGYPELTPYGRQFKLNGYTFSSSASPWPASPPVAALVISSFTHTAAPQPPIFAITDPNDNLKLDAVNLYYAGKVYSNVGAFAQGLYSPLTHRFQLFTSDIRYAAPAHLWGKDVTYGLSLNNNPGVTDPWNTGQSFWSYPFENTHVLIPPVASPAIQGRYALQVLGANSYVSWNQFLYADLGFYGSPPAETLNGVGINARGADAINGAAPYWRLAVEPAFGRGALELGTFGFETAVHPHRIDSAGADRTLDLGVDTEYQLFANRYSLSVMGSYIHESSRLNASHDLGFSSNTHDDLNTINVKGTYYYNQTYGANLGYFQTTGTSDATLYGLAALNGSPDSSGLIGELDYYPFNRGAPGKLRDLNLKFGLQYTYYTRFDGGAADSTTPYHRASDHNTLFLYTWLVF